MWSIDSGLRRGRAALAAQTCIDLWVTGDRPLWDLHKSAGSDPSTRVTSATYKHNYTHIHKCAGHDTTTRLSVIRASRPTAHFNACGKLRLELCFLWATSVAFFPRIFLIKSRRLSTHDCTKMKKISRLMHISGAVSDRFWFVRRAAAIYRRPEDGTRTPDTNSNVWNKPIKLSFLYIFSFPSSR